MLQDFHFIIFIYLFLLLVLVFLKPVYISSNKLILFRALFPSWRFYEDLVYLPVLYYRRSDDGVNFSVWEKALKKTNRRWSSVLINSEGNLLHACNSMLQQLENAKEDIDEDKPEELIDTVSYQLVKNLIETKVESKNFYQFKLVLEMQGDSEDAHDVLYSITHEVQK